MTDDYIYLLEINRKSQEVEGLLEQLISTSTGSTKDTLTKIKQVHTDYTKIQKQVLADWQKGNRNEALNLSFGKGLEERRKLWPLYQALKKQTNSQLADADARLEATMHNSQIINLALAIISVILSVFLGFYIPNKIVTPLQRLVNYSRKVADGDFTEKAVEVTSKDEISELTHEFNIMIGNTKELISKVVVSAQEVADTGQNVYTNAGSANTVMEQVASAIQEVAKGMTEQTNFVNETTQTVKKSSGAVQELAESAQQQIADVANTSELINQMAVSIQNVTLNAQTASKAAEETKGTADKGANAVQSTVKGMEGIKSQVFDAANKISKLGEHSVKIGEIIRVIDEIAEQTNLLALNAAIEAARAGEHGKGFAVVADEVRKLAERSSHATKEIADLINNIQTLTSEAVSAMQTGTQEVEKGFSLAEDAGSSLKEIMRTVQQTYNQIQNISVEAEQLFAGSQQVVTAMDRVAKLSQANTAATEGITKASHQVTDAMNNIAAITEQSSASSEEVSASTVQMSETMAAILHSAEGLAMLANDLKNLVGKFSI